jgi:hypothetical protein
MARHGSKGNTRVAGVSHIRGVTTDVFAVKSGLGQSKKRSAVSSRVSRESRGRKVVSGRDEWLIGGERNMLGPHGGSVFVSSPQCFNILGRDAWFRH